MKNVLTIRRIIALAITIIAGIALNYLMLPAWSLRSSELYTYLFLLAIVAGICFFFLEGDSMLDFNPFISITIIGIPLIILIIGALTGSIMFNAKKYQSLVEIKEGDFSQEVVDTTGKMMSKFYLKAAADTEFLLDDGVDKHFENAIPIVENIAKESMTVPAENYGREAEFVGSVLAIIEEDSDPVKIALLKDVYEALDNKCIKEFDFGDLIKSEVSPDVIKENLKTIKDDLGLAYGYGKIVNVNEYLTKNPEDKKIPFRNLDDTVLHRVTPEELTERFKTGNYI